MTAIIMKKQHDHHDVDAPKDCADFRPLDDGTIRGDRKYCNLSFQCKQIGMFGQWVELDREGVVIARDYLCTGKCPIFEERSEDGKAS